VLAYLRCYSPRRVPLRTLVRVAGQRWRIEESLQAAKSLIGLDQASGPPLDLAAESCVRVTASWSPARSTPRRGPTARGATRTTQVITDAEIGASLRFTTVEVVRGTREPLRVAQLTTRAGAPGPLGVGSGTRLAHSTGAPSSRM